MSAEQITKDVEISTSPYSMNPLDDIDWGEDEEQYMFDIPTDEFLGGDI